MSQCTSSSTITKKFKRTKIDFISLNTKANFNFFNKIHLFFIHIDKLTVQKYSNVCPCSRPLGEESMKKILIISVLRQIYLNERRETEWGRS
jgi:hypothetical protein